MNEDEPTSWENVTDVVLPSQFFDMCGSHRFDDGEKRLKLAVLADAIRCWRYPSHSSRAERDRHEANIWLFHPNLGGVFSFNAICEALGIDASWLRRGLGQWRGGTHLTQRSVVNIGRRTYPTPDRPRRKRHQRAKDLPFVPV